MKAWHESAFRQNADANQQPLMLGVFFEQGPLQKKPLLKERLDRNRLCDPSGLWK